MKHIFTAVALLLSFALSATAEPLHLQFNINGYGPTPGTSQTYASADGLTFNSDSGNLYWDEFDGFGIMGPGYEDDEIEGDERFEIEFNRPVHLLGFNVTDLFHEQTPPLQDCPSNPACYLEWGAAQFEYADGSRSLFNVFEAPFTNTLSGTNGAFDIAVNERDVVSILFMAPGDILENALPGFMTRMEFSVAGVIIDNVEQTTIPEPASLVLFGTGLIVLCRRKLRG